MKPEDMEPGDLVYLKTGFLFLCVDNGNFVHVPWKSIGLILQKKIQSEEPFSTILRFKEFKTGKTFMIECSSGSLRGFEIIGITKLSDHIERKSLNDNLPHSTSDCSIPQSNSRSPN